MGLTGPSTRWAFLDAWSLFHSQAVYLYHGLIACLPGAIFQKACIFCGIASLQKPRGLHCGSTSSVPQIQHCIFFNTKTSKNTGAARWYGLSTRAACTKVWICSRGFFFALNPTQNCSFLFHPLSGLEQYSYVWNVLPPEPKKT